LKDRDPTNCDETEVERQVTPILKLIDSYLEDVVSNPTANAVPGLLVDHFQLPCILRRWADACCRESFLGNYCIVWLLYVRLYWDIYLFFFVSFTLFYLGKFSIVVCEREKILIVWVEVRYLGTVVFMMARV